MSQDHEQQQERIRLKNQTKALYQATRRANPVLRSLEQSSDTPNCDKYSVNVARKVPDQIIEMFMKCPLWSLAEYANWVNGMLKENPLDRMLSAAALNSSVKYY